MRLVFIIEIQSRRAQLALTRASSTALVHLEVPESGDRRRTREGAVFGGGGWNETGMPRCLRGISVREEG